MLRRMPFKIMMTHSAIEAVRAVKLLGCGGIRVSLHHMRPEVCLYQTPHYLNYFKKTERK